VNENESIWEVLVVAKKTGFFLQNLFFCLVFGLQNQISTGEDLPVWNTMKADGGGAYVNHDRGVLKFREFYQSWVDKVE
jgi:hypothetical protein